jgi:release factor glutamine methyltransferase
VARWRTLGVEPTVVDVGTGAGAVAVSLALEVSLRIIGTDLSCEALSLARENAYRLAARASFVQADLLSGLRGPLHVVLANLPYVPRHRSLPRDVKDYEPHVALFGGERGTELIERFLHGARPLLVPGSTLAVELDEEEQSAPVATAARELYPAAEVSVRQDNGGYDRVVHVVVSERG